MIYFFLVGINFKLSYPIIAIVYFEPMMFSLLWARVKLIKERDLIEKKKIIRVSG